MNYFDQFTPEELATSTVFPSTLSPEEQKKAEAEIGDYLRKKRAAMTPEETRASNIFTLRYIMTDYLKSDRDTNYTLGHFLKEYLYAVRGSTTLLAKELGIHTSQLSRFLHDKEEPSEKIFFRLQAHSKNEIPAVMWFRILNRQKEEKLINDKIMFKKQSRFVKIVPKLHRKRSNGMVSATL